MRRPADLLGQGGGDRLGQGGVVPHQAASAGWRSWRRSRRGPAPGRARAGRTCGPARGGSRHLPSRGDRPSPPSGRAAVRKAMGTPRSHSRVIACVEICTPPSRLRLSRFASGHVVGLLPRLVGDGHGGAADADPRAAALGDQVQALVARRPKPAGCRQRRPRNRHAAGALRRAGKSAGASSAGSGDRSTAAAAAGRRAHCFAASNVASASGARHRRTARRRAASRPRSRWRSPGPRSRPRSAIRPEVPPGCDPSAMARPQRPAVVAVIAGCQASRPPFAILNRHRRRCRQPPPGPSWPSVAERGW